MLLISSGRYICICLFCKYCTSLFPLSLSFSALCLPLLLDCRIALRVSGDYHLAKNTRMGGLKQQTEMKSTYALQFVVPLYFYTVIFNLPLCRPLFFDKLRVFFSLVSVVQFFFSPFEVYLLLILFSSCFIRKRI